MAYPVIQCKDQGHDSSKSGEIHGPIHSGENKGGQDVDLTEIITVGTKHDGSNLEGLPHVISVDNQLKNGTKNNILSNTSEVKLIHGPNRNFLVVSSIHNIDSCVTIHMNSEVKPKEDLTPLQGLGPHHVINSQDVNVDDRDNDLVGQTELDDLPRTSDNCGSQDDVLVKNNSPGDVPEILVESNKGQGAEEPQESSKLLIDDDHFERECPICTELYDASHHKQSLLNCNHVFCDNCIKTMVGKASAANLGKVACPLCRQTTPMMEWEIRKMQEQMLDNGGILIQQEYVTPEPIVRRPGLCGALEYRFQKRFRNGRLIGFPPCVRHPQRLVDQLNRLQNRCHCLYLCALLFLLFAEFFCFFFLFLPIFIFILMIIFGK